MAVARHEALDERDGTSKIALERVIREQGVFWHLGSRPE
jgi:hypothetical protein